MGYSSQHKTPCLSFDGADDLVTVSDDAAIQNIFDGGGTFECWFYARSDGENSLAAIIRKESGWNVYVSNEAAGLIRVRFEKSHATNRGEWHTEVNISLNLWYHLAVTYDPADNANNPTFYIDGAARTVGSGLTESATPSGAASSDAGQDLFIGNRTGADRTFDGLIDEVRLWSDVRTAAEISANYDIPLTGDEVGLVGYWSMRDSGESTLIDYSNGGNDGTISGASWVVR